jgi:uncharacterized circularly permuted ATP-grasp superfamily protein
MSATTTAPSADASYEAKLLESYHGAPNRFDELTSADGQVRPRWQQLLEAFAAMGSHGTKAAQDKARRLLLENGVTFTAQGDADSGRPWRLDLFPLLIEPAEWSVIERGLIQRTQLLNRLLMDLYGEQRVLKDKLLPPGLVFGNSQFLRPCTSVKVRDDLHLHFVAFDLARSADGRWWVLSDRTQALGRGLRARESSRVVAMLAGALCRAQRASPRELLPLVQRALPELIGPRRAAGRIPVAWPLEAELLRARLSRALPRLQRRRRI